jgi:hypothetical protein
MRRLALFTLAIAAFAALGSGCLFDTRPANAPVVDGGGVVFDDPEDVFQGMRSGLESNRFSEYERALGDDFIFSPLLSDSLDQTFTPTTFSGWTRQVERDVMLLVVSEADSIQVEFTPKRLIDTNSYVQYRTEYRLRVVPRNGDAAVYAGVALLDVRRIRGQWQVTYWDEIGRVDPYQTWGFLRGITRGLL